MLDDATKKRLASAIERFEKKNDPRLKEKRKRAKNQSPEKLVERLVLSKTMQLGMFVTVVESKGVWSTDAHRWVKGQAEEGFPDLIGCDSQGNLVAIELKAKGKRSTLKAHQRAFLMEYITRNAFAMCADSPEIFERTYTTWLNLDPMDRKKFLVNELPKPKEDPDFIIE